MSQDPHERSEPHREHDAETQRLPTGDAESADPQPGSPSAEQPEESLQPEHPHQQHEQPRQPEAAAGTPGWGVQPSHQGQSPYGPDEAQNPYAAQSPYPAQGHYQPEGHYQAQGPNDSWSQPPQSAPPKKDRRGIGCGTFALGVLLAGLLGGGAVAGTQALLDDSSPEIGEAGPGIEINDPDDATAITAAADHAAPSVVTLAVGGQGGSGSGSGIILDNEGHVLTNTHVVTLGGAEAQPDIQVQLNDGRVTTAEIVGTDPLSDLAVIRLADTENLEPADLGSSSDLNVGDQTIAIGAPLSLAGTVTTGIVSTLDRTIQVASAAVDPGEIEPDTDMFDEFESEEEGEAPDDEGGFEFFFPEQEQSPTQGSIYLNVIQTDAAINQGNSGGALVDSQGRVIGVNVAIASAGGGMLDEGGAGSIGVGFAIPIDYAQRVASDLIENGETSHGLLGVQVLPAHPESGVNQEILDASEGDVLPPMGFSAGGLVTAVSPQSPAAEAGIEEGDVIEEVEGRRIEDGTSLTATVREYGAEETITLTVLRNGERQEIDVTLASM